MPPSVTIQPPPCTDAERRLLLLPVSVQHLPGCLRIYSFRVNRVSLLNDQAANPLGFNVGSSSNALRAPPTALRATMAFESPRALRGCMVLRLKSGLRPARHLRCPMSQPNTVFCRCPHNFGLKCRYFAKNNYFCKKIKCHDKARKI